MLAESNSALTVKYQLLHPSVLYIETHCFALEDSLVIFVLHPTHTSVFMHLSLHSE